MSKERAAGNEKQNYGYDACMLIEWGRGYTLSAREDNMGVHSVLLALSIGTQGPPTTRIPQGRRCELEHA